MSDVPLSLETRQGIGIPITKASRIFHLGGFYCLPFYPQLVTPIGTAFGVGVLCNHNHDWIPLGSVVATV